MTCLICTDEDKQTRANISLSIEYYGSVRVGGRAAQQRSTSHQPKFQISSLEKSGEGFPSAVEIFLSPSFSTNSETVLGNFEDLADV